MPKVTINGQVHQFDGRYPLHAAIELEERLGWTFGKWQEQLSLGSAKAVAGYIWLVLRADGQKVALADILSGKFEIDTDEIDITPEGGLGEAADPTIPLPDSLQLRYEREQWLGVFAEVFGYTPPQVNALSVGEFDHLKGYIEMTRKTGDGDD